MPQREVRAYQILANRESIREVSADTLVGITSIPECKFCMTTNVIRYGHDSGKQVFKCKACRRKFVPDNGFRKLQFDPTIITVSLDLYFKGTSLRKISDHLHQFYNLETNFSTLYRWIKRYVQLMSRYVSTLPPNLSGKWQADEMKIKCDGEWKWLWSVMDKKTRFLLASEISRTRTAQDASRLFAKAKSIAKGLPKELMTDGLTSYRAAFSEELCEEGKPTPEHIRHIQLSGERNNNLIERFQGTRRERDKVLRGTKTDKTPIRKGLDVYYNFIRPHMGLDGKTPAQVANVGLDPSETNRWMLLLKKSLNHHRLCNTDNEHR